MAKESAVITSRQNPLLKELQKIRDDRGSPLLFLEGPRLIQEALNAGRQLELLIIGEQFPKVSFLDPVRGKTKQVFEVTDAVFQIVSDVENPQGLLAICRKPEWQWPDLVKRSPAPIVILDGLQDPGNAASIVRTAESAGAAGIVTTPTTARLYSPKALRGAMGSSLRLPILEHVTAAEIGKRLEASGYGLLVATMRSKKDDAQLYFKAKWKSAQAVVLGQEGKGVSNVWEKVAHTKIYLPMNPPVESLNVGAAAAVLLYESLRQRQSRA